MEIIEKYNQYNIQLGNKKSGQFKTFCPFCRDIRTNKNDKSLSVNLDKNTFNCHYPQCPKKSGQINKIGYTPKKEYSVPTANVTNLSEKIIQYFSGRGISPETLEKLKITQSVEYFGKESYNSINFNYYREEKLINIKFRPGKKMFKLVSGAELIFYNLDAIKETTSCIIVEGEIDCLSFVEIGLNNVVSVPNGASLGNSNLEYLDNCIEYFENKEEIIIATDNDEAGINLRNELVRRLDAERCSLIDFGDCKDANELLCKSGRDSLKKVFEERKQMPINSIITAANLEESVMKYYDEGMQRGLGIELFDFDKKLTFDFGRLCTVTGIPSHGKSSFVDFIITRLNIIHGIKFGLFSPENYPMQMHASKLIECISGKSMRKTVIPRIDRDECLATNNYINDNFFWAEPDNEDYSISNILDIARKMVKRHGIRGFVLDPWNRCFHDKGGESKTDYVAEQLKNIINFSQKYSIMFFLVAHPRKMNREKGGGGKVEIPTLYDISDSAHFYNMTDFGICGYRDFENDCFFAYIQKVKFKNYGEPGLVMMKYDKVSGRFSEIQTIVETGNFDSGSYIFKNELENSQAPITPRNIQDEFEFTTSKETPF